MNMNMSTEKPVRTSDGETQYGRARLLTVENGFEERGEYPGLAECEFHGG